MTFSIQYEDKKTKARIGLLKTKSGTIETPFFMPVATKTSVKYLSAQDLKEIGVPAVISNAFILSLRPGKEIIKKLGGIRKFMQWSGITVTDSGGFQMYSPRSYISSTDQGVLFKNPFTEEKLFITPEENMKIQLAIHADVAMCLDTMPLLHHSKDAIDLAVKRTTLWAKACQTAHKKLQQKIPQARKQLLFCISQGGIYPDLRKKSLESLLPLNFEGYAIGGLALGETKEQEMEQIKIQKSLLPKNKLVYLMGAGHPVEILEAIALGVDMFDSRFPTQNARRGTILTSKGRLKLLNSRFAQDIKPLDSQCGCFVCKNYSRAYLRFLLLQEEGNARRLVSYHNVYYITKLIEKAKDTIKQGTFLAFKNKVAKVYAIADKKMKTDHIKK